MNCKDSDFHISSTGCCRIKLLKADDIDIRCDSTGDFKVDKIISYGDFDARLSSTGVTEINELQAKEVEVRCSSTGNFYAKFGGNEKQQNIDLKTSSIGGITVDNINAEEVESIITSSGDIKLSGKAEKLTARISSSGEFDAIKLRTEKAEVRGSGSGTIRVYANKYLELNTSGSGSVYLKGSPKMNFNMSGSGRLISEE